MDLVPRHDRLIVLAQVKPEDIDLVRPGLQARVRLLSYKHRRVPPVEGVLTYVSADRLIDKVKRGGPTTPPVSGSPMLPCTHCRRWRSCRECRSKC